MKAYVRVTMGLIASLFVPAMGNAQSNWPKEIPLESGGKIILYQLQPEHITGNRLTARAALSVRVEAGDEPIFGAVWLTALMATDKDERLATLDSMKIREVKFPETENLPPHHDLTSVLQKEIPKWQLVIPLDELVATLEGTKPTNQEPFSHDPPKIIYARQPSMLVLIDGEPIVKMDDRLETNRVINTPYLIVENPSDQLYYLYAGACWYRSSSITSGWTPVNQLPFWMRQLNKQIKKQEKNNPENETMQEPAVPPAIVVSTQPAELIQTTGEAHLVNIEDTGLLYVSNTEDNLFLEISSQQYYVVISGRWYRAPALQGPWSYVASEALPRDFSLIPETSPKGEVLTYVPGTQAAREAVLDAQIPQTARVDRRTVTSTVVYDGDPQFEPIEGTRLSVAINSSHTVLKDQNTYYCVENGIWFVSGRATGPWTVSVERPRDVDRIPPNSLAYPVKYVYIYDRTPDYVYMGYTAGYLGCYVYGPTIVYGTGYRYRPWYGRIYIPRPLTWGFGLFYSPWTGWNFGFSTGWFNYSFAHWSLFRGWWGPHLYRPYYRPPIRRAPDRNHSQPDRNRPPAPRGGLTTNLYHYGDRGVVTQFGRNPVERTEQRPKPRNGDPAPKSGRDAPVKTGERPPNAPIYGGSQVPPKAGNVPNNVYSDQSGNPYQRDRSGIWQRRDGQGWRPANPDNHPSLPQLQRDHTSRERSNDRVNQFQQQRGGVTRPANPTPPPKSPRTGKQPR